MPRRSPGWSRPCARARTSRSKARPPKGPPAPIFIRSKACPRRLIGSGRSAGKPFIMNTDLEAAAAVIPGFIEKAPLERYVDPDRPSLVGRSRAELAAALGELGVPQVQRKMRAQQLWHWLYVRGVTSFDAMTS